MVERLWTAPPPTGLPDDTVWADLGHGIEVVLVHNGDRELIGLLERHACRTPVGSTYVSVGSIPFRGASGWPEGWPRWSVQSLEPLALTPSVQCGECGRHGVITGGQWLAAPDDGHLPRDKR